MTEKFNNKQDYAEETEGSSLNDTECENSSEENFGNKNTNMSQEFRHINTISVKKKRTVSNKLDVDELKNKRKKTIYTKSFDLSSRKVINDLSNDVIKDKKIVNTKAISDNSTSKNNVDLLDENINVSIEQVTDKDLKTVTENIDVSNKKTSINADELLKTKEVIYNCNKNIENHIEVDGKSITDNENSNILIIDEDTNNDKSISKKQWQNNIQEIGSEERIANNYTITIDSEDEPIITEPEVIIHKDNHIIKDVIKINELDDSDVEITNCDISKDVKNNKSLESIIKSSMFDLHELYSYFTFNN